MPGYAETLSEEERWDLACFIKSLHVGLTALGQIVLVARKHDGSLPLDPTDPFWDEQTPLDVPLAGQVIVTPRQANATINLVTVRAAYSDKELAFHFSWNDRFKNPRPGAAGRTEEHRWVPELDEAGAFALASEMWARRTMGFEDQLQIQFPVKLKDGPSKPFFFMGDGRNKVNLWTWRADWSEDPGAHDGQIAEERNAAGYKKAPVTQEPESQAVDGRAVFEDGRWRLVLKRSITTPYEKLDTQFEPGAFIPFALQAWDGGNGEEGLLCAISSWYYVALEGQTDRAGYVWAALGVLLTLGGGRLAVRKARSVSEVPIEQL